MTHRSSSNLTATGLSFTSWEKATGYQKGASASQSDLANVQSRGSVAAMMPSDGDWLAGGFVSALCMTSRRFLTREFNGRVGNKVNRFSLPMRFDPIRITLRLMNGCVTFDCARLENHDSIPSFLYAQSF